MWHTSKDLQPKYDIKNHRTFFKVHKLKCFPSDFDSAGLGEFLDICIYFEVLRMSLISTCG